MFQQISMSDFLVVQLLRLCTPNAGAWVQSLVGQFHMPGPQKKKSVSQTYSKELFQIKQN